MVYLKKSVHAVNVVHFGTNHLIALMDTPVFIIFIATLKGKGAGGHVLLVCF